MCEIHRPLYHKFEKAAKNEKHTMCIISGGNPINEILSYKKTKIVLKAKTIKSIGSLIPSEAIPCQDI